MSKIKVINFVIILGEEGMVNINKVILGGNLATDPKSNLTPSGKIVVKFRLAVNRKYKDSNGKKKIEKSYFTITVWNQIAESCQKYLKKGMPVMIEGRLYSNSYFDTEGRRKSNFEIIGTSVSFLAIKRSPAKYTLPSEPPEGRL